MYNKLPADIKTEKHLIYNFEIELNNKHNNLIDGKIFNIVRIFIYYFQWYVIVIKEEDGNHKYFMVFIFANNHIFYYRINSIEDYCNIANRL